MTDKTKLLISNICMVVMAICIGVTSIIIIGYHLRVDEEPDLESRLIYTNRWETDHPALDGWEDPNEADRIVQACIAQIGTETERECFGYSFTTLMKIITHEGGSDYEVCHACATCLFNATVKVCARYDPVEMADIQQFASPKKYYSEAAKRACIDVFIKGVMCEEVQDATVFHCLGRGNTNYHDGPRCEWVCKIGNVDYYREVDRDWSKS